MYSLIRFLHRAVLFAIFTAGLLPAAGPHRSLVLTTGTTGTAPLSPNAPPYSAITDWRVELRVHNWTQAAQYSHIFMTSAFAVRFVAGSDNISFTSWPDNSAVVWANIKGRTDFIVRFQRNVADRALTAEVWNSDGTNYGLAVGHPNAGVVMKPVSIGGEKYHFGDIYNAPISCQVPYLRMYSTLVPLGTAPSTSPDGDLGDWEFENDGTDQSAAHLNMTFSGGAGYANTPLYAPHADPGGTQTIRAGQELKLDGQGSFSANEAGPLTYFWQQVSGPLIGAFALRGAAAPSVLRLDLAGTYEFRLTVSDGTGLSSSATVKVGVVATDDTDVVIFPNSRLEKIIGPVTRSGVSPWPWYDIAERANGDLIGPAVTAPAQGQNPMDGTITLSPGSGQPGEVHNVTITGTDTHFTTDFAPGDLIWAWWNTPEEGPGTGRALFTVSTITDDTHITTSSYYHYLPGGTFTDIQYSKPRGLELSPWAYGGLATDTWNFYDVALALYRLYYRTGIDSYRDYARNLADKWWTYGTDHGYENRLLWIFKSMAGLMARAEDGRPELWDGIASHLSTKTSFKTAASPIPADTELDLRERGYELEYDSLVAMLHPNAATRATFCTYVANAVNNVYFPTQRADGSWPSNPYAGNAGYPYGGEGMFPFHAGVTMNGLAYAYEVLADPNGCNNATTAGTAKTVLKKALDFVYQQGRGANRGLYYSVNFYANGQPPQSTSGAGTVTGAAGATALTGSGTAFATFFACNGTDYIGIDSIRKVFKVLDCPSATSMTLDAALPSAVTGSTYKRAPAMPTDCAPSSATYCEGAPGDRSLINTMTGAYGHFYHLTGEETYKNYGDELFSAAYGGSGGGPGSLAPPAGPGADGEFAHNYINALPPCNTSKPPCGGFGLSAFNIYGKGYGQASGAGGAPNYLAYRVGGGQPYVEASVQVNFDLSSVMNATQARIRVVRPSGEETVTVCSNSPCQVPVDPRQGQHRMTIEYLSAEGDVLSKTESTPLPVP